MYDSEAAIFYGSDPAGQGYAPFAYAGNNPVMMVDPNGKSFFAALIMASKAYTLMSAGAQLIRGYNQGGFGGVIESGMNVATSQILAGLPIGINLGNSQLGMLASSALNNGITSGLVSTTTSGNFSSGFYSGLMSGAATGIAQIGTIYADFAGTSYDPFGRIENPNDDKLLEFTKKCFSEEYSSSGNPVMSVTDKRAGGVTEAVGKKLLIEGSNNWAFRSHIKIGTDQFSVNWQLYLTTGHELLHAKHFWEGSMWGWGWRPDPKNGIPTFKQQESNNKAINESEYWTYKMNVEQLEKWNYNKYPGMSEVFNTYNARYYNYTRLTNREWR